MTETVRPPTTAGRGATEVPPRPARVPEAASRAPRAVTATVAPAQWHRGITLLALVSMFIGTRDRWTQAVATQPVLAEVISLCYAAILVLGVLTLVVRGQRALVRVDVAVLLLGVVLVVCAKILNHAQADESVLMAQATKEFVSGRPIYGRAWPWVFDGAHVLVTKTMSGGTVATFGYP